MKINEINSVYTNYKIKKYLISFYLILTNILIILGLAFIEMKNASIMILIFISIQIIIVAINIFYNFKNTIITDILIHNSLFNKRIESDNFAFKEQQSHDLSNYIKFIKDNLSRYKLVDYESENVIDKLESYFQRYFLKLSQFILLLSIGLVFIIFVSFILYEIQNNNYLMVFLFIILRYMILYFLAMIFDYISFYYFYKNVNTSYLYIYSNIYLKNTKHVVSQLFPPFNDMIKYLNKTLKIE